jgi:hypothetical protein
MITSVKLFILALLFVVTGGALFSDWARRRPVLVALASLISILGAFYLFRDVYDDLKSEVATMIGQGSSATEGAIDDGSVAGDGSFIGPSSVWSPPQNVDLYSLCQGDGCLIDSMERHGASPSALQGARILDKFGSRDSFFYGFQELGGVDAAYVNYPFIMSEGNYLAFVNCRPEVMFASELLGGEEGKSLLSRELRNVFGPGASPEIWAFLEVRYSSSRSSDGVEQDIQDIVTLWDIRNSCRACEVLGTVEIRYSFWDDGSFLGYDMLSVHKQ